MPKTIETTLTIPAATAARMYADVQKLIDACPSRVPTITVSEFAASDRVLPRGTPYPGPWRNERTPYLVEIMDALSASSPITGVAFAKSAQVGATSAVENLIAYIIKSVPGPTLYCTANEKLLAKWVNKRLTPLLVSCGLDGVIDAQSKMKGGRRTGNKMFSKEFPGGSLDMVTAGSAANLRSDTVRYLILDELDGYPLDVDKEGDPVSIAEARTKNWKRRKKILYISTPTTAETSHIWPLYESGDRRKYFVPCPHCGEFQVLEFGYDYTEDEDDDRPSHGMKWEVVKGHLDPKSIYYECEHCHESIYESKKWAMLQKGEWRPTAISNSPLFRSYHISAIYSLMEDWVFVVQAHLNGEDNALKKRAFVNTGLGLAYREVGKKINHKKIRNNAGLYKSGTIPDMLPGVLYLTAAIDIQRGQAKSTELGPRLEMEICGHGRGYRTWSILYKVFRGDIGDAFDGAWEDLFQWAVKNRLTFLRPDGMSFSPQIIGIDSADGETEGQAFQFCTRWQNTFPIKGFHELKKTEGKINDYLDPERHTDFDRFRERSKAGQTVFQISTNWYKKQIYSNLAINRREGDFQRPNFMDHPKDYGERYYKMLTAEELRPDGTFWKPSSRANEALDLKVYNCCLAEIWLAAQVKRAQGVIMKEGNLSKEQVEQTIRSPYVLDYLEKLTARRKV